MATIDPTLISHFQHVYIAKLSGMFSQFTGIATTLFYILAAIELALFGIAWALRQDEALGSLAFKIFKLAVIFFIITAYPMLLKHMIDGFTSMSAHAVAATNSTNYLFNPAQIWQFGFNSSIAMLKLAVQYGTANIGMSLIYIILGFGMLFMFGLIGAAIVLLVVGFYIVSLVALILLPFGALSVMRNFLTRALTSVIAMGARVFALVLILGIGFSVWSNLDIATISQTTTLSEPLGLFFVTLVLLVLVLKVPSWAARAVGEIGGSIFDELKSANRTPVMTTSYVAGATPYQNVAAGATAVPGSAANNAVATGSSMTGAASGPSGVGATASASTVSVSTAASGGNVNVLGRQGRVAKATEVGISRDTLKKLKATFKEAMKDSKS